MAGIGAGVGGGWLGAGLAVAGRHEAASTARAVEVLVAWAGGEGGGASTMLTPGCAHIGGPIPATSELKFVSRQSMQPP
eukprot:scaffold14503_cov14-Tisochrysis_lutea.AAC.1